MESSVPLNWSCKAGFYGFQQNDSDYSLFTFEKDQKIIQVSVYVDDLIIAGNSTNVINRFKSYLSSCFHMNDFGVLRYFFGIEVARNPTDIISETGLLGVKPVSFPIKHNHKLALADGPLLPNATSYRRLVGKLIYLGTTRSELSYPIHILSQFMGNPRSEHWEAALRVVRYLKNSPGQRVLLHSNTSLALTAWCIADWGGLFYHRQFSQLLVYTVRWLSVVLENV